MDSGSNEQSPEPSDWCPSAESREQQPDGLLVAPVSERYGCIDQKVLMNKELSSHPIKGVEAILLCPEIRQEAADTTPCEV